MTLFLLKPEWDIMTSYGNIRDFFCSKGILYKHNISVSIKYKIMWRTNLPFMDFHKKDYITFSGLLFDTDVIPPVIFFLELKKLLIVM